MRLNRSGAGNPSVPGADGSADRGNRDQMTVKPTERIRPSRSSAPTLDIVSCGPRLGGRESHLSLATAAVSKHLRVASSVIDGIAFGLAGASTPPHLLRLLVSTVLATDERSPICIVLPSVERVASVIAILSALECLSFDLPESRETFLASLRPGQRVRLYPTGEVFEIGGVTDELLRLHFIDAKSRRSNATWSMPLDRCFRFKPTLRCLPLGTAAARFGKLPPNDLEAIVGSQLFGNSGLIRTRILLVGPRAEFDRTLHNLTIRPRGGFAPAGKLAEVFPFGTVDADGVPIVIEPPGSGGQPMVAIARDLLDLEQSCLGDGVAPGSRAVLTDKIDLVLRDLSLAGRIGERQRLVAFADARNRAELGPLRKQGWSLWEISPRDIIEPDDHPTRIGSRGIDRSLRGAGPASSHAAPPICGRLMTPLPVLGNISRMKQSSTRPGLRTFSTPLAACFFHHPAGSLRPSGTPATLSAPG